MLTACTSDTVNIMQGFANTDTVPDMQQITPLIRELFQQEEVIVLVLFGSFSRGHERSISDIDLCIITSRNLPSSDRWNLMSYGSRQIDVNIFWDLPINIRFRVIQEGCMIFCKDALFFHRVKTETVREYIDVAPLIRKHCIHAMSVRV